MLTPAGKQGAETASMRRSMAALSVLAIALVCVVAMAGASAARAEHRQDAAQYERLLHKYGYNATRAEVEAALGTSFLQVQAKEAGGCEVCMYVIENKQHHQPYLCRGIKDPAYQQTVRAWRGRRPDVLRSLCFPRNTMYLVLVRPAVHAGAGEPDVVVGEPGVLA